MNKIYICLLLLFLTGCSSIDGGTLYLLEKRISALENIQEKNSTTTIWVQTKSGGQIPIKLKKIDKDNFAGPKGEIYKGIPTSDQLGKSYSF